MNKKTDNTKALIDKLKALSANAPPGALLPPPRSVADAVARNSRDENGNLIQSGMSYGFHARFQRQHRFDPYRDELVQLRREGIPLAALEELLGMRGVTVHAGELCRYLVKHGAQLITHKTHKKRPATKSGKQASNASIGSDSKMPGNGIKKYSDVQTETQSGKNGKSANSDAMTAASDGARPKAPSVLPHERTPAEVISLYEADEDSFIGSQNAIGALYNSAPLPSLSPEERVKLNGKVAMNFITYLNYHKGLQLKDSEKAEFTSICENLPHDLSTAFAFDLVHLVATVMKKQP